MAKFYTTIFTVLFFIPLFHFAQSPSDSIKHVFSEALEDLVVIKNDGGILPIRRLDTARVALIGVGLTPGCDLQRILENYSNVQAMMPPRTYTPAEAEAWVAGQAEKFNIFVLGINDHDFSGEAPYLTFQHTVKAILKHPKSIAVVFGGQDIFTKLPLVATSPAALIVTQSNEFAHSLAAQVIMGGVGASAKLRSSDGVSGLPAGTGLMTKPLQRFRFSPPELAGMNHHLLHDSIKAIVEEGIEAGAFPGAQVLVAKNGHVIYHEAFGHHTFDNYEQVTTKDIYDYASVTKISSALPALMKLHGEGKFDLDAKLQDYMPEFSKSNKGQLTFRSMLAHNAQLRPWVPYWKGTLKGNSTYPWKKSWDDDRINDFRFKPRTFQRDSSEKFSIKVTDDLWLHTDFKKKKIYKAIKKSPLNEKPGYVYSGLLFYLLPEMVEQFTQTDFETYIKRQIFEQIGAYSITYNPHRYYPKSRIIPTERDTFFRMVQIRGWVHDEGAAMMGGVSANAGLFSTTIDLAKLMQLYLDGGSFDGRQVLPKRSVAEFTRCQFCADGNRRGLGFDKPLIEYDANSSSVAEQASPASFGHSGYTGTFAWADPENGLLFVFMSNRVHPTRDNRKLYQLGIRPRLHQAIYDAIEEN